jgi:hypothetical protein
MYKKLICLVCFVLVLEMVITSGANAADPNLVGWWKFDEASGDTAIDSSGNGFDIPLQNHTWGNGVFGGALHFPGEGQGQLGGFSYSNNAITVCAWVWHEAFRTGQVERYVTAEPEIMADCTSTSIRAVLSGTCGSAMSLQKASGTM